MGKYFDIYDEGCWITGGTPRERPKERRYRYATTSRRGARPPQVGKSAAKHPKKPKPNV